MLINHYLNLKSIKLYNIILSAEFDKYLFICSFYFKPSNIEYYELILIKENTIASLANIGQPHYLFQFKAKQY